MTNPIGPGVPNAGSAGSAGSPSQAGAPPQTNPRLSEIAGRQLGGEQGTTAAAPLQGRRVSLPAQQQPQNIVVHLTQQLENITAQTGSWFLTDTNGKLTQWITDFEQAASDENLQALSTSQQLQLTFLLAGAKRTAPSLGRLSDRLNAHTPPHMRACQEMFENVAGYHHFMDAIQQIGELNEAEKWVAAGHYITANKIPAKELDLTDAEWERLAPFLRYVDLLNAPEALLTKLFQSCTNINHLFINSRTIRELPALPLCQTLDCSTCPLLAAIPAALPLCQHLNCQSCPQLAAIPAALPLCQNLICFNCPLLAAIPAALPLCQTLVCYNCPLLAAIPAALPLCQKLICSDCPMLAAIPATLPLCQYLDCHDCPLLAAIPAALPLCEILICSDCPMLAAIPATLPLCQNLNFFSCPLLAAIPAALPLCHTLNCSFCPLLAAIPTALPLCQTLDCSDCPLLAAIPAALPLCQRLNCSSCPLLAAIPAALSLCQRFNCSSCPLLAAIPAALPLCQTFECFDCPLLAALPAALPLCQTLDCRDCPLLAALPELSFNARVYSDATPATAFSKLEVDINDLVVNPKKWLLELGRNYLLNGLPFPNIYYFEEGVRSEAIDVGGVRRDFVTRLCENILIKNWDEIDEGRLNFNEGSTGVPETADEAVKAAAAAIRDSYRTLGKLFALCYPANSYFKTGPLFPLEVYQCLAAPASPWQSTEEADQWLLYSCLSLKSCLQVAPYLMDTALAVPNELPEDALRNFTYLVNPEYAETAATVAGQVSPEDSVEPAAPVTVEDHVEPAALVTVADLRDPEKRASYRAAVLDEARSDKRMGVLMFMASAMKESLDDEAWNQLRTAGAERLRDRIEGTLSKEALLEKLRWIPNPLVDPARYQATQGYLRNWIENANIDRLRLFVRTVTSNKALGPDDIKVDIFNRGGAYIPVAHTCFFSLELSGNYPTQEVFNEKLNYLLTEGMAGTGFQVA